MTPNLILPLYSGMHRFQTVLKQTTDTLSKTSSKWCRDCDPTNKITEKVQQKKSALDTRKKKDDVTSKKDFPFLTNLLRRRHLKYLVLYFVATVKLTILKVFCPFPALGFPPHTIFSHWNVGGVKTVGAGGAGSSDTEDFASMSWTAGLHVHFSLCCSTTWKLKSTALARVAPGVPAGGAFASRGLNLWIDSRWDV